MISVLSLIAKQLSNKQLSNYDFRKQKYLKKRNSQSKKLSQVLRNIDTQFANVFPCQFFWKINPLLLFLPYQGIKQKKKLVGWNTS